MGEAYITRRGGRAASYAIIGVTVPSGSTVICTNGDISLEPNGSGTSFYFRVPKNGAWTVTATKEEKTKSETVNITARGQCFVVAINYGLSLISGGVIQNPNEWTAEDVSIQNGSGYVDLVMSHAAYAQGMYAFPVDLTDYSKITVDVNNAGSSTPRPSYKWLKAAIKQTNDANEPATSGEYINLETHKSRVTLELDVSGKTGTWYVGFYGHGLDITEDESQPAYLEAIARVYNLSLS